MSIDPSKSNLRQAAARIAGWLIFGIVIWFVGRALIEASRELDWSTLHPAPHWIAAGVGLYILSLALVDVVVRHLYRHLGTDLRGPRGFVLYMVPTLGRYIPGKVLSLAGHVFIARKYGVDFSASAAAIALLTVVGLTAAMLVGFLFLLIQPSAIIDQLLLRWVLVAGTALIAVGLLPGLWFRLINAGLRLFHQDPLAMTPGYAALLASLMLTSAHVILLTGGYATMTAGVTGLSLEALPMLIGAICVANTLGFIAVFAPAGLGVREGVLLLLLGPTLGAGAAALFAITLRLVQILGDAAAAAVGLALLRRHERIRTAEISST